MHCIAHEQSSHRVMCAAIIFGVDSHKEKSPAVRSTAINYFSLGDLHCVEHGSLEYSHVPARSFNCIMSSDINEQGPYIVDYL